MKDRIAAPTPEAIAHAAHLLQAGRLVAFPTETVYGLGANARDPDAVQGIFAAKGRPSSHPLIVHVATAAAIDEWASHVPASARALADAFWPGPLTLILRRRSGVPDAVTGGQDTVGLRVPSHPVAQALLVAFRGGVAGPSANRFGRISPTSARHVADDLGLRVDLILDGGDCPVGIESTIVACLDDRPMLLRPGGIGVEALTRVLGQAPRAHEADAPRASGTLAAHYAPATPASLVAPDELRAQVQPPAASTLAVLARTVEAPPSFAGTWIAAPVGPEAYAHDLYANLRKLDRSGARRILVEAPPDAPAWWPVADRLRRATHGDGSDDDAD